MTGTPGELQDYEKLESKMLNRQDCEAACDDSTECNSFKFCDWSDVDNCFLQKTTENKSDSSWPQSPECFTFYRKCKSGKSTSRDREMSISI